MATHLLRKFFLWYMTRYLGNSVFVVRFPFILAGMASVYFVFKLAKEWISTTVGLLVAAFFATLAFPILYSRLARPYALGMLFVSMASFFWIRIVKKKEKPSDFIWPPCHLQCVDSATYFAALVGAILSVSGIVLVEERGTGKILPFAIGRFCPLCTVHPHISVSIEHRRCWSVAWSSENDWLWNHIDYAFNNSSLIQIAALIVGVRGFTLYNQRINMVNHVLPFVLFLLPFLVGFFLFPLGKSSATKQHTGILFPILSYLSLFWMERPQANSKPYSSLCNCNPCSDGYRDIKSVLQKQTTLVFSRKLQSMFPTGTSRLRRMLY